jgi:hypothetical protein
MNYFSMNGNFHVHRVIYKLPRDRTRFAGISEVKKLLCFGFKK